MESLKTVSFGIILILMGMLSSGIIDNTSMEMWNLRSYNGVEDHGILYYKEIDVDDSSSNSHLSHGTIELDDTPSNTRSMTPPDDQMVEAEYIDFDEEGCLTRYDYNTTFYDGGTILWEFDTSCVGAISTPALGDLNCDGDLEIVFASAADKIYALDCRGNDYWMEPYGDDEIVPVDEVHFGGPHHGPSPLFCGEYDVPPLFSSVTLADIDGGKSLEILCGVKDGILCLNTDGSKNWKKGLTNGYYFSTPTVTDLEGEFTGDKTDLEVVVGSDGTNKNAWIEAFHGDGDDIFRYLVLSPYDDPGLITMPPISGDIDGTFDRFEDPGSIEGEETWHELVIGGYDHGLQILNHSGTQSNGEPQYSLSPWYNLAGHQTYGTSVIGNCSKMNNNDPWEYEIIIPSSNGYMPTWANWVGNLYCYDRQGTLLWSFSTGGAPSSIFTSPAVADVQVSEYTLSEEIDYEVFFGADNGKVYSISCDDQEVFWTYQTGGRILSSPAICNIDADEELEVIIGSNDGMVYCFDGDPSDDGSPHDDGTEDSGGSVGTYDLLWKCDTQGSGIGISSPVVGDINGDGMLEVVIGDKGGKVYCIAAGGESVKYQCDWPTFHHDLNHTGFYEPDVKCGVSLTPWINPEDGLPDSMVKNVEPCQNILYNITIENTGIGGNLYIKDTYTISIDGIQGGWKAKIIEGYDEILPNGSVVVSLISGERRKLVLNVSGPSDGYMDDLAQIDITATSKNDATVFDSISTTSHLSIILDFDVEFVNPSRVIDSTSPFYGECFTDVTPGSTYFASLKLVNLGNINDSFTLSIETLGQSWDVTFTDWGTGSINSLELSATRLEDSECEITIPISIDVPPDALVGDLVQVDVEVTSVSSLDITPEDPNDGMTKKESANFQASRKGSISISCDDIMKYVDAGEDVRFSLKVINDVNMPVDVHLEMNGHRKNWIVEFDDHISEISENGGHEKVEVKVIAPEIARAQERLSFSILASAQDNPDTFDELELMVIVNPVFDFSATIDPLSVYADPGDELNFDVNITNIGNSENEIHPLIQSLPTGWSGDFGGMDQDNVFCERASSYLEYNSEIKFKFRLKVGEESESGTYPVILNITGEEGSFVLIFANIMVNQVFNISLRTYTGSHVWNANIGFNDSITQLLEIRNSGNDEDVITISTRGLSANWFACFDAISNTPILTCETKVSNFNDIIEIEPYGRDMVYVQSDADRPVSTISLKLDERSSAWFSMVISSPSNIPFGNEPTINIDAHSFGKEADRDDNHVFLNLTIDRPNLCIEEKIGHSEDIKANDYVTFHAKFKNSGQTAVKNILVQVKVDGAVLEERTLSLTPSNIIVEQRFNWIASPGPHVIEIILDPHDTITETNEDDNTMSAPIHVAKEDTFGGKLFFLDITVISILVGLLIVVAIGSIFLLRRRKQLKSKLK